MRWKLVPILLLVPFPAFAGCGAFTNDGCEPLNRAAAGLSYEDEAEEPIRTVDRVQALNAQRREASRADEERREKLFQAMERSLSAPLIADRVPPRHSQRLTIIDTRGNAYFGTIEP